MGGRFFSKPRDGSWRKAVDFVIRNPACADYPQWTPEPWPSTRHDGNMAVTLSEFQSGGRKSGGRGKSDEKAAPRKTPVGFYFTEKGRAGKNWAAHKVTIFRGTGKPRVSFLELVNQKFRL